MTIMTQAAFAKHLGVQKSYVKLLKDFGRLVMEDDKVMVEESIQRIEATKDPSKQGVADRHQQTREQKAADPEQPAATEQDPTISTGSAYQQARAMKEKYNAMRAKLDYEKETGVVLMADQAKLAVSDGDTIVRNRLESLPDILAPQLASEQDEQRIRALLTEAIEQILIELSKTFTKMMHKA